MRITGLVHATGGGVPGKLLRLLRGRGLGAVLDHLFPPGEALAELIRLGEVPEREAYETWCMGQGMLALTPEPSKLVQLLAESGVEARTAGQLVHGHEVEIASQGPMGPGEWLVFRGE